MKTLSFIGSDKNAGKTTALNFIYDQLSCDSHDSQLCITSIGINGEEVDYFDGKPKPEIHLNSGAYFVTAMEHVRGLEAQYKSIKQIGPPEYSKTYLIAQCRAEVSLTIEGPNRKSEIKALKDLLQHGLSIDYLLIDGSTDRLFLGDSSISDGFYFSILLSEDQEQKSRACELLHSINIPLCDASIQKLVLNHNDESTKSLLFDEQQRLQYQGEEIPFLDPRLKNQFQDDYHTRKTLYLHGSLSRQLANYLAPFDNLLIVLDSFLLHHNLMPEGLVGPRFNPALSLLHPVSLQAIFVRVMNPDTDVRTLLDATGISRKTPIFDLKRATPERIPI